MSGGKIAPWIYKNLEHKSYVGLYWEDDGKYFRVIWQKKGTTGYEKTLEVCRVRNFILHVNIAFT